MSDGKIVYEVQVDDSKVKGELSSVGSKISAEAKSTSDKMEKEAKETGDEISKQAQETGEDINKATDGVSTNFSSKLSGMAKVAGVSFAAIGAAAIAVGTAAVTSAVDLDQAVNQFAASTGTAQEEMGAYEETLKNIYANNYGESFEDIANAMATVKQQVGELDQASLQTLTESAFLLRDTFEYDVGESVRAASTIMEQFGTDGETAMNLIATGAQNGLDFSGELIDSINEYSVHFAKVGLDAEEMFAVFEAGAESGAFNLDKIGDAVKEMSIRVVDGSDTTIEGFELIGLSADEMAAKFAAGGESAKEAFTQTIEALAGIEDPLAQNQAGVDLFGTMWEDLGADAVTALADIQSGAYETSDALSQMGEVKYDDLGSMLEGLKRSLELLLIPLGETLVPAIAAVAEQLMPVVEELLPPLSEILGTLIESVLPPMLEVIEAILPPIVQLVQDVLPPIIELIEEILPPLMELVETLLPPLVELAEAIIAPLAEILGAILPPLIEVLQMLIEPLVELLDVILPPLMELFEALAPIIEALSPIITFLASLFSGILASSIQTVMPIIEALMGVLEGLLQFITGVFTGDWESAWEGIKKIFGSVFEAMKELFKAPINWIIDKLNAFIRSVNRIKIPDWVPGVGGKSINLSTIPRLKVGLDYVPDDDFPALLHKGEAVLTAEDAAIWRSVGGSVGLSSAIPGGLGGDTNYNIAKFADYFVVREEADIDKISAAIYRQIRQLERARGLY